MEDDLAARGGKVYGLTGVVGAAPARQAPVSADPNVRLPYACTPRGGSARARKSTSAGRPTTAPRRRRSTSSATP